GGSGRRGDRRHEAEPCGGDVRREVRGRVAPPTRARLLLRGVAVEGLRLRQEGWEGGTPFRARRDVQPDPLALRGASRRRPVMMLKDKVAVIYGAGGAIGGAVACAFASEGATVFLTGHRLAPVEAVAKEILAAGGSAEAAEVDALDEQAVDRHLQSVIDAAGRVDISF